MNIKDLIDTHAHVYPLKIAAKASANVGKFYGIPMAFGEGTAGHLLSSEIPVGIRKIVIHSVATAKEQVFSINRFLSENASHPVLHPFGTLHPGMDGAELRDEVAHIRDIGLHGIKLHPDCQQFAVDGPESRRMMDAVAAAGMDWPVLLHAGDNRFDYSHPSQIVALAKDYPQITFIAAHFGGYNEWEKSEAYLDVPNVVFDTSSSLAYIPTIRAENLIHRLGAERFMFATDYPMWNIQDELRLFFRLRLTEAESQAILAGNARRILKIPA